MIDFGLDWLALFPDRGRGLGLGRRTNYFFS